MNIETEQEPGHVEMGIAQGERDRFWAGHLTVIPGDIDNVVGLKAVLLEEASDEVGHLTTRLDQVLNDWAEQNWKTYNIVDMKFLPSSRAVMLLVAKVRNIEDNKELWEIEEGVRAFVHQYRAKKHELEIQAEETRQRAALEARLESERNEKEQMRLVNLGRLHEANCGKKKGGKK